jgi:hypothetical protein
MKTTTGVLTAALIMLLALTFSAQGADHNYVGAGKCKVCHMSKKKGAQFGAWKASKHSKAFETLGTPAAKEVAAKAGIKGNPQEAAQCLSCHVTGADAPAAQKVSKYDAAEGVTCESCHGAGEDYAPMKVMRDHDESVAAGMIIPTVETCKSCHNEKSPTFKGFNCAELWAEIAHDNPATEGGAALQGCK